MIDILFILGQAASTGLFLYGAHLAVNQGALLRKEGDESRDNALCNERLMPRYIQDNA